MLTNLVQFANLIWPIHTYKQSSVKQSSVSHAYGGVKLAIESFDCSRLVGPPALAQAQHLAIGRNVHVQSPGAGGQAGQGLDPAGQGVEETGAHRSPDVGDGEGVALGAAPQALVVGD